MTARRIVAALLIIVASILAPFAVGARWANQTLTNSAQFTDTIAPLADDPLVQQAVESAVSEAVIEALDIENRLDQLDLLPSIVTEAVASGVNSAVENVVEDYVQSDRFGEIWISLARGIQEQFVVLLGRDGSGAIRLQDGTLVLDTAVVADLVKAELDARGVPYVGDIDAGLIDREIVLTESPNLQIAADALRIFMPVSAWLWLVVVVMLIGGILLWRPRARGALWAGLGLLLGGAITWAGLNIGSAQLTEAAPDPNMRALLRSTIDILVQFLVNSLLVMMALGLALIVGGWLAGGTRSGRRVRDRIAEAAHGWGAPLADSPIGRFTSEHPMLVPTLRGLVLVGALAFLLTADRLHPSTIVWTVVVVGGLLLAVEVIEGSGLSVEQAHAGALRAEAVAPGPPVASPTASGGEHAQKGS
jgi:hypothetical protein